VQVQVQAQAQAQAQVQAQAQAQVQVQVQDRERAQAGRQGQANRDGGEIAREIDVAGGEGWAGSGRECLIEGEGGSEREGRETEWRERARVQAQEQEQDMGWGEAKGRGKGEGKCDVPSSVGKANPNNLLQGGGNHCYGHQGPNKDSSSMRASAARGPWTLSFSSRGEGWLETTAKSQSSHDSLSAYALHSAHSLASAPVGEPFAQSEQEAGVCITAQLADVTGAVTRGRLEPGKGIGAMGA
jgi:hypothetical protein